MAKSKIDYAATMVSEASKRFGGARDDSVLAPDPVVPTDIPVTIDNLVAYKDNYRRKKNPKYDEIKESIRNVGLDYPPKITRQSPDQPYMIKSGGNTRLQILRELYEETGDDRFYRIDCKFIPWSLDENDEHDDIEELAEHIRENELHGYTILIERAGAADRFRTFFEKKEGKSLSISKLAVLINSKGWPLNNSNLNQLLYSHDVLLPVIPNALWDGPGYPFVKKIRKLISDGETLWTALAKEDDPEYNQVWQTAFSELDQQELFDYDEALLGLEKAIAKAFECELPHIQAELQSIMQGGTPPTERPVSGFDRHPPTDISAETKASVTPIRGGASEIQDPQVTQSVVTAETRQPPGATTDDRQAVPLQEPEPVEIIGGQAHPRPEQLPCNVDIPSGTEDAMTAKMTLPQDHPQDWYRTRTQNFIYPNSALNRRHARKPGDGDALPLNAMLELPFEQFICEWDYYGGNPVTRIRILKKRLQDEAFLMLQLWALDDAIVYHKDERVLNDPLAPPFLFNEAAVKRVIEKYMNCEAKFYQKRDYQDPEVHLRWRQLGLLCYVADVLSYCMDDFDWNNPNAKFFAFPNCHEIDPGTLRMARGKISEIRALGSCPGSEDIFRETAFYMGCIDACMGMIMRWRIVYTDKEGYLSHGFPID
ncbi:hypothetical protein AB835_08010 [Candidatus Endobugula sertula]|uniref:ParB/Sulfiredoxin domain-containing protein n=1 Tax=Candidatus Endobugula sertula TaxID=62101 RepID=A0A1D2QPP1_9GAMM|nr:hypothetical protein AB835_08010 [Candidatus Endobugula sertula]